MNRGSTSLPNLVRRLWEEGFFATPKSLAEVSDGLATKGYHFRGNILGVALLRIVRSTGLLMRAKEANQWKYVQKHPPTSVEGQRAGMFEAYDLHPRIKEVSLSQFEDGHFKEAIQNALVEVIDHVKIATKHPKDSGGRDLDGDSLMNTVFGCDNGQKPKMKFNALKSSLDRTEQRGMMYLFKGVVGIRDRKAHLNFVQRDPVRALEYLALASLLMRLVDEHGPAHKKKA